MTKSKVGRGWSGLDIKWYKIGNYQRVELYFFINQWPVEMDGPIHHSAANRLFPPPLAHRAEFTCTA
ncbi:hypothetical protein CU664_04035 [Pseudomonas syringae pv. actinidifoliorum]|nr:hypothetical protein [Pseudomonas syringae pv. actinidifoliorum]NAT62528.1 hypothetical protein [Pseudomonas syringae pv. actinidifoliorum]